MISEIVQSFRDAVDSGDPIVTSPAAAAASESFAESVARRLAGSPRRLDCQFLYDARGSELFERITGLPEYYPTRTEAALLEAHAEDIRATTGDVALCELGSGHSVKTRLLLDAYSSHDPDLVYAPIDVSRDALDAAHAAVRARYPDVCFRGIHGTYADAFSVLAELSPSLVMFLGSTIGNFAQSEFDVFWSNVADHMQPGDWFLLGADLVKDPGVLTAAYDDAAGVTAEFTKNYFARMNRELGTELDLDAIEHVATWNAERRQIEIYARFTRAQTIRIEELDATFEVAAGEQIEVEISRKFELDELRPRLAGLGFETRREFVDANGWYGLLLLQRSD